MRCFFCLPVEFYRYVGLFMVCNGICYVTSSYLFGWLSKYIGRIGCFLVAALLNYAMIILMYFWQPNNQQMIVLFVIAGVWAIADAIWQSQVIGIFTYSKNWFIYKCLLATYTVLYSESDPTAVAKYRLWKAVGSLITFSVSFHSRLQWL